MNSSKKKEEKGDEEKKCVKFEPQAWRKNLCRNCFKTRPEHEAGNGNGNGNGNKGKDATPSSSSKQKDTTKDAKDKKQDAKDSKSKSDEEKDKKAKDAKVGSSSVAAAKGKFGSAAEGSKTESKSKPPWGSRLQEKKAEEDTSKGKEEPKSKKQSEDSPSKTGKQVLSKTEELKQRLLNKGKATEPVLVKDKKSKETSSKSSSSSDAATSGSKTNGQKKEKSPTKEPPKEKKAKPGLKLTIPGKEEPDKREEKTTKKWGTATKDPKTPESKWGVTLKSKDDPKTPDKKWGVSLRSTKDEGKAGSEMEKSQDKKKLGGELKAQAEPVSDKKVEPKTGASSDSLDKPTDKSKTKEVGSSIGAATATTAAVKTSTKTADSKDPKSAKKKAVDKTESQAEEKQKEQQQTATVLKKKDKEVKKTEEEKETSKMADTSKLSGSGQEKKVEERGQKDVGGLQPGRTDGGEAEAKSTPVLDSQTSAINTARDGKGLSPSRQVLAGCDNTSEPAERRRGPGPEGLQHILDTDKNTAANFATDVAEQDDTVGKGVRSELQQRDQHQPQQQVPVAQPPCVHTSQQNKQRQERQEEQGQEEEGGQRCKEDEETELQQEQRGGEKIQPREDPSWRSDSQTVEDSATARETSSQHFLPSSQSLATSSEPEIFDQSGEGEQEEHATAGSSRAAGTTIILTASTGTVEDADNGLETEVPDYSREPPQQDPDARAFVHVTLEAAPEFDEEEDTELIESIDELTCLSPQDRGNEDLDAYQIRPFPSESQDEEEEEEEEEAEQEEEEEGPETTNRSSIFHHYPESDQSDEWTGASSTYQEPPDYEDSVNRAVYVRRRRRGSAERDTFRRQTSVDDNMSDRLTREEAMMEGHRMLMDNLRTKVVLLEDKIEKLDREKNALGDLLSAKKGDYRLMEEHYRSKIGDLDEQVKRLSSEKGRLMDRLRLPESERHSLTQQENEIATLQKKLEDFENRCYDFEHDNSNLKQEIRDLQLEMEEMHDQFREEEALEFRELQKELEATAKNCRILQFKLRKSERRNEQLEADRQQYEDKIRQLEGRFRASDDKQHIRELEEELEMAKEVSVRLHDELELVEEKRSRYEEELDRVNDILTESETRRLSLQADVKSLQEELQSVNGGEAPKDSKSKLGVPSRAPKLNQAGKDGSMEYEQLMRDLSDSLERENDLKEQLKYAEEEARIMRKKLSDMDDENESLNLQLQKLSAAKSGMYFKKDIMDKDVVTEREHELRLQMELAEQELKVLHRKMDDMYKENEDLLCELKACKVKMLGQLQQPESHEDNRSYEERIKDMAEDIDKLKWKLIEQDQEASGRGRKGRLQKSRSLEESGDGPGTVGTGGSSSSGGITGTTGAGSGSGSKFQQAGTGADQAHQYHHQQNADFGRQLDILQQEAQVLRDKLRGLEKENSRLTNENKQLSFLVNQRIPSITADDAALQNVDLKERGKQLERENANLKDRIRALDQRTSQLAKAVTRSKVKGDTGPEDVESRDVREQLRTVEEEFKSLRKKMAELETQNGKLIRDLDKYKMKADGKDKKATQDVEKLTMDELRDMVYDMEGEIKDLMRVIKNRERENNHLESEINEYRDDMEKMMDAFRDRERELLDELESLTQKNQVISSLLDLVTERAESAQKELDKVQESTAAKGERSASVISAVSDVSVGSDEVFLSTSAEAAVGKQTVLQRDWEAQLEKRIETLEGLLTEERQKVLAAEQKMQAKDGEKSNMKVDAKLHEKEKIILQQELELCQKQLQEASENVNDLKERLEKVKDAHDVMKSDYEKLAKELEDERQKKKKEEEKDSGKAPKMATWRWEKQELERQIKEHKKKVEDLHAELKKQQFKWKAAGEDIEKEHKKKQQLEKQIEELKAECASHKTETTDVKNKLTELQDNLKKKEEKWEKEKEAMELNIQSSAKEAKQKDDVIQKKDDIIKQKDSLVKEKDTALKDRDQTLKTKDSEMKKLETDLKSKTKSLKEKEKELEKSSTQMKEFQGRVKEQDAKTKSLNDEVRSRDERIREKNEILEQINRKLIDKENQISEMDKSIRQATKKLEEKESELKKMQTSTEKAEKEVKQVMSKMTLLKEKLSTIEQGHSKEMSVTVTKCEKLEKDLATSVKDKKALNDELDSMKDKLKTKEQKFKKDKDKLELDLKQANEKLRSSVSSRGMKESEVVKALNKDKEGLISEKHKLSDDVNQLRKDVKESSKQWDTEKQELKKVIKEKTKLVEENTATCERLQKEIDRLRSQVGSPSPVTSPTGGSPKLIPIPVHHESTKRSRSDSSSADAAEWQKERAELQAKLERHDLMLTAEKVGMKELYEGKMRGLDEQLGHAQEQVSILRGENDKQLELLQSSRKALSDLRNRYDAGLQAWNEEREHLEKKVKQAEETKTKLGELESKTLDLKTKLQEQEAKYKEAKNKLAMEKNAWNTERSNLETKLKKHEESGGSTGRVSSGVGGIRAKFEKFEPPPQKKKPATSSSSTTPSDSKRTEKDKVLEESQKIAKDLQTQLSDADKARETDRKELMEKIEDTKKYLQKERKDLRERNVQLESRSKDYADMQKSLVDTQYKLQEERETWQKEKNKLLKQVDETRKTQIQEKDKISELLAEIKKLKEVTSMLEASASLATKDNDRSKNEESNSLGKVPLTPTAERHKVSRVIKVTKAKEETDDVKKALDETIVGFLEKPATPDTSTKARALTIKTAFCFSLRKDALRHISRLAEDFRKPVSRDGNRREKATPSFRRSLSTSEVDDITVVHRPPECLSIPAAPSIPVPDPSPVIVPSTFTPQYAQRRHLPPFRPSSTDLMEEGPQFSEPSYIDRRSFRGTASNRSSMYKSGTQSAYTSRDASPDKGFKPKKISPYPAAPPSMIITPSQTPRREHSVERQPNRLNSRNMVELFEKLSAIEQGDSKAGQVPRPGAGVERKGSIRVLKKSMSMDSRDDPPVVPDHYPAFTSIPSVYDDAPLSQTMPGTIRIGGLMITPGVESLSRTVRKQEQSLDRGDKRTDSLSPKSARRKFFEEYPYEPKSLFKSWPERRSRRADFEKQKQEEKKDKGKSRSSESKERSLSPTKKSFFQTVKDKRKLFGGKRSASVDSSAVHSSIARIGVQVLPVPGAPSTFEPPSVPVVEHKKKPQHKRTSSIETYTSLLSTTPKSSMGSISASSHHHLHPVDGEADHGNKRASPTGSTSSTSGISKSQPSSSFASPNGEDLIGVPAPTLTPKFKRPRTPPNRRPPARWRRSFVQAADNPVNMDDEKGETETTKMAAAKKKKTKTGKKEKTTKRKDRKSASSDEDSVKLWKFNETAV